MHLSTGLIGMFLKTPCRSSNERSGLMEITFIFEEPRISEGGNTVSYVVRSGVSMEADMKLNIIWETDCTMSHLRRKQSSFFMPFHSRSRRCKK
jgi:hypothetical protein